MAGPFGVCEDNLSHGPRHTIKNCVVLNERTAVYSWLDGCQFRVNSITRELQSSELMVPVKKEFQERLTSKINDEKGANETTSLYTVLFFISVMDKWLIQNLSVGKYKVKCYLKLPDINFCLMNKHYIDPTKAVP